MRYMKPKNWIALAVLVIGSIAWCILTVAVSASIIDFSPQSSPIQIMWLTLGLCVVMLYLLIALFWVVFWIERW